jgi:hypothetical protein
VALDDTGITLALRRAADIDVLAHLEEVDLELGPRLEVGAFAVAKPELVEAAAGIDLRMREMTRLGLRRAMRLRRRTDRDLHSAIAVTLGRLHGRDAIRQRFNDGDRNGVAVFPENAGHAAFSAY